TKESAVLSIRETGESLDRVSNDLDNIRPLLNDAETLLTTDVSGTLVAAASGIESAEMSVDEYNNVMTQVDLYLEDSSNILNDTSAFLGDGEDNLVEVRNMVQQLDDDTADL